VRRRALLLLAAAALPAGPAGADPAVPVVLEGPAEVQQILKRDVDRDGVLDLLAVEGRTVWIWKGRRGLPPAAEGLRVPLPEDVSAVDVEGPDTLLLLGTEGVRRLALPGAEGREARIRPAPDLGGEPLAWRDAVRATFVDLVRPGGVLLPASAGWLWRAPGATGPAALAVERERGVTAPGPFLEDAAKVEDGLPEVVFGAPWDRAPDGPPVLWSVSGPRLLAQGGGRTVAYDLSFLPAAGERRLADLDGDGVPDVLHGEGTNKDLKVAFFRTPPPPPEGESGGSLRPPLAYLHLTGYPLAPATVDLDGDGRLDFVLTSIEIDAKNVVRALQGQVTAQTRAFLNRLGSGDRLFGAEPDAVVTSDIGVRIRFGYTGNIDIQRSFTIVTDGDYDGDGRRDLVIREGPDAFRIRRGTAVGVWEAEGRRVSIPPLGEHPDLDAVAADLTGDGKDELVLVYRRPPGGRDRLLVLAP
jgi:hypothetical protein